jgi:hypothetical protein
MKERHDIKEGQSTLKDVITISPDVIFRELDGEAVILNLETGTYFGLDEVGTRMWQLIADQVAIEKVVEVLLDEYEVEEGRLRQDVIDLIRQLMGKGLVRADVEGGSLAG